MKKINPKAFTDAIQDSNLSPIMGVPCSTFKGWLNYLSESKAKHYACVDEGQAVGLASGFALARKTPVVYMQSDGFCNALNPLTSLVQLYHLPMVLFISWRGVGDDAPQHEVMGIRIATFLDILQIPYDVVDAEDYEQQLEKASRFAQKNGNPYTLLFKRGTFEDYKREADAEGGCLEKRAEYIKLLGRYLKPSDIVIAGTGFCGRELYALSEHPSKFYMMGSMGCLNAMGLGLAESFKDRRVFVLDGDGALLMKMGSLATIGHYKPKNLIHVCFDNGEYESTGGQMVTSIDFKEVASQCGYESMRLVMFPQDFEEIIEYLDEGYYKPMFINIEIDPGIIKGLKRPSDTPDRMKIKFIESLED